jgi:hypothetical protein
MRYIEAGLSLKRAEAGRMGGIATYMKRGVEGMQSIGKLGGRPRLETIEELMEQHGFRTERVIERRALPGEKAELKLSNIVRKFMSGRDDARNKKEGEPAGYQTVGSPEGDKQ